MQMDVNCEIRLVTVKESKCGEHGNIRERVRQGGREPVAADAPPQFISLLRYKQPSAFLAFDPSFDVHAACKCAMS